MRRLLAIPILALVAAAALAAPAVASAAYSCTPTANHGGEHAPVFQSRFSIAVTTEGGYNCTKDYTAVSFAQYEESGSWHQGVNQNGQALNHSHGPYNANEGHLWTEATWNPVVDGGLFNPCHYNWRVQVQLFSTDGLNEQIDVSPVLFSTC